MFRVINTAGCQQERVCPQAATCVFPLVSYACRRRKKSWCCCSVNGQSSSCYTRFCRRERITIVFKRRNQKRKKEEFLHKENPKVSPTLSLEGRRSDPSGRGDSLTQVFRLPFSLHSRQRHGEKGPANNDPPRRIRPFLVWPTVALFLTRVVGIPFQIFIMHVVAGHHVTIKVLSSR